MGKIAIVFSGQGAQSKGMGKDLYDNFKSSREVFETAEKMRKGILELCFEGGEELNKTVNTQPCMFVVDVAAHAALGECAVTADAFAGFSLGELAAAVCGGMLDFEWGFKLVCKRAEAMHNLSPSGCGMAAVLKLDAQTVENLCREVQGVYPANYNCQGQIAVAGSIGAIDELAKGVSAQGGRLVKLSVSGAFHSPYMEKAYSEFKAITDKMTFSPSHTPVYSNVTALPYGDPKQLLPQQIISPVRWQKTMENMIDSGVDTFIEAGWGNTLVNMIKRINASVSAFSATNKEEILQLKQRLTV